LVAVWFCSNLFVSSNNVTSSRVLAATATGARFDTKVSQKAEHVANAPANPPATHATNAPVAQASCTQ
jgi:hypothetical protein